MASARDLAAELLLRLDRRGGRLDADLDAARRRLEDPRERGLLTELAFGCVRRRGTLDAILTAFGKRPVSRLNAAIRVALRLGLYQILFLDRVPAHAAVDHAVGWARGHAGGKRAGYVNGVLRNLLRQIDGQAQGKSLPRKDVPRDDGGALRFKRAVFADPRTNLAGNLAARFSMPQWLLDRWLERWGDARVGQILRTGIQRPPLTLRARHDVDALVARLEESEIGFERGPGERALRVTDSEAALRLVTETGEAAVQDATSQRAALLLAPRAGESVLDLCAAPGGKTLQLADLMGSGHITACDITADKVARLEALREQMGDVAYETRELDPDAELPFAAETFDAILVDAPCSNTGVLRRRVEARWRLRQQDVDALVQVQRELLERCLAVLKPGGRIVYSTCSLEPEENEQVVEAFRARHPEFT
ncbi:MAG: transcription antitermination factor NusB, partial [Planctomycetota bacterium]|nr:transcription antitermination factor NusB [Planctomycetota bacterium]